jgi:hypothetical protein
VYAAERAAWGEVTIRIPELRKWDKPGRTLAEAEKIIRALADRKRVTDKYPVTGPRLARTRVTPGRNGGMAYQWSNQISLGVHGREHGWVIIHEAAHIMVRHGAPHGWQFSEGYLFLWRQVFGVEAAAILERQFKAHRVAYKRPKPKRQLTDEQKAVLVERLKLAREVKAVASPRPYRTEDGTKVCAQCPDGEFYYPCPVHSKNPLTAITSV